MMSAVSFAVAPTISFRSSSWISPSTEPSISRSSLPEISPLIWRLGPSRAVARSAVAPIGRRASVLIVFVPSQVAGAGFAADSLENFSSPVARLAAFPAFFGYPTSAFSQGQVAPCGFAVGVFKTLFLCGFPRKQHYQYFVRESNYPQGQVQN